MINRPLRYEVQDELTARGYTIGSGATFRGSIIAVEHIPADRGLVDAIIHEVDVDAFRY
jgi:hypothetical protein